MGCALLIWLEYAGFLPCIFFLVTITAYGQQFYVYIKTDACVCTQYVQGFPALCVCVSLAQPVLFVCFRIEIVSVFSGVVS